MSQGPIMTETSTATLFNDSFVHDPVAADPLNTDPLAIHVVAGPTADPYQDRVAETYADPPGLWRKAIGDHLMFQFGVYDDPSDGADVSLDDAGVRYLDRQLELAAPGRPERVMDLGCGWGFTLRYLADRFPDCRVDGVNISRVQLEYCADDLAAHGLADRVNLYLCNARDVALLPDDGVPYDLVTIRGAISHFPYDVYEAAVRGLASRVRPGGRLVISENLYRTAPGGYRSEIPDTVDRMACGYRKTPAYLTKVLTEHGFAVRDMRVLPSNADAVRWLQQTKENIETRIAPDVRGAIDELRVIADNWSAALRRGEVSTYSVIAERVPPPPAQRAP
jgi:cyclopropane fatty-acyl-phospholipid synthase-like methyltransferase